MLFSKCCFIMVNKEFQTEHVATKWTLAKPLHTHDTVSVHFNYFTYMKICDTIR